mgnify:CR=1 FL=1
MLRLPPFRYVAPPTLAEVVALLDAAGPKAVLLAGGTDLLPRMKRRQRTPELLVGLRHLRELQEIVPGEDGGLVIGAGCTLHTVSQHPAVVAGYPALARAAAAVASPTLRRMGTIGGNLCIDTRCTYFDLPEHTRAVTGRCLKDGGSICLAAPRSPRCWAVASSDTAPLLVALEARVRLVSPEGERVIPLRDLYRNDGLRPLALRPAEVLTEILLPPADGTSAIYRKVRRRGSIDFPLLGVAIAVRRCGGRVAQARVVLGAVSSAPLVVEEASRLLREGPLDPARVAAVAAAAAHPARPLDNTDLTAAWRKRLVRVTVARALEEMQALWREIGPSPDTLQEGRFLR